MSGPGASASGPSSLRPAAFACGPSSSQARARPPPAGPLPQRCLRGSWPSAEPGSEPEGWRQGRRPALDQPGSSWRSRRRRVDVDDRGVAGEDALEIRNTSGRRYSPPPGSRRPRRRSDRCGSEQWPSWPRSEVRRLDADLRRVGPPASAPSARPPRPSFSLPSGESDSVPKMIKGRCACASSRPRARSVLRPESPASPALRSAWPARW